LLLEKCLKQEVLVREVADLLVGDACYERYF
jgi:hypothetical protein